MKVYPNDPCPCGSGKKYKKCCMKKEVKQTGCIGNLKVYSAEPDADFYINTRGAVVYKDESKQPVLELSEGSTKKNVLSVGVIQSGRPIANIQEEEGVICYILPDWYASWCQTCVGMAMNGVNIFPAEVIFSSIDGVYSVDVL